MANQWLRLWHDMPNDPKWRTIARISGQRIADVIAVYIHLLVDASRNVTRGHVTVTNEDLASALDVTNDAIASILSAMQSRVMNEDRLTGWDQRQVKREDDGNPETSAKTSAERKREQRERERMGQEEQQCHVDVTQCHDTSRNVTLDKDKDLTTSAKLAKARASPAPKIGFNCTEFLDITPDHRRLWAQAYPAVDITSELAKAATWLHANPKNRKSNYARFIANWLTKAQDRAPRANAALTPKDIFG